jgi:predicted ATPase/DNA-binding XRE family transcriptional regulator
MDKTTIFFFGDWVRRRRRALDLTQAELGARVGASAAMIRKVEAGERRPSRELAELLAATLSVPAAEREDFLRVARGVAAVEKLSITDQPLAMLAPAPAAANLPAPMTSMIDRVTDLAAVTALIQSDAVRLVTVIGPPGMGKTRLSIAAAQRALPKFADGVWFVDLSAITDPALLLPTIAITLGLLPVPGLSSELNLHRTLRDSEMLLVLDNLEQIVDRAAVDIAGLLRACRHVKVLATSRVRLDVYGEHEYALPPMSIPPPAECYVPEELARYEGVQLFVARTRQHQPDFALTAEIAAPVAAICRRMEGVPLALELAAARTRQMPPAELAAALQDFSGRDWHALLRTSARDLPPRQQTLFNAIAWSCSLLEPSQRSIFRQLSVFAGAFDWPAVAVVVNEPSLGGEVALRNALDRLADHSLVSVVSHAPERWRMLEMVREFARAELSPAAEQAARARHAHFYADRLWRLSVSGSDVAYWAEANWDASNGRAALTFAVESAHGQLGYQLAVSLGAYWEHHGLLTEGRHWLEQVLALPSEIDVETRYEALYTAANLAWMQHDFPAAHAYILQAVAETELEDAARVAALFNLQARVFLEAGRLEDADRVLLKAIALARSANDPVSVAFMIIQRGDVAFGLGDIEKCEVLTRAGLTHLTDEKYIPFCLGWTNLAEVALAHGDAEGAAGALRRVAGKAHLHTRRERIFLVAVAGLLLLDPSSERGQGAEARAAMATCLLAYVTLASERCGQLSPVTQRCIAVRTGQSQRRLPSSAWQAAWESGRRWTAADAFEAAVAALAEYG